MVQNIGSFITNRPELTEFAKIFACRIDDFRVVGGAVRDYLLGINNSDIDVATTLTPEELLNFIQTIDAKFYPIGGIYGTIAVQIFDKQIEITPTRLDIKTYGRQADIKYTPSFEIDSKRRDFTINALYVDFNGNIYDYHNGQKDLTNKVIKFIGRAEDRIKEDYLRILRAYRFEAQIKGFKIYGADKLILEQNIANLALLSKPRIKTELFKILATKSALEYLEYFASRQILQALSLEFTSDQNLKAKNFDIASVSPLILIALLNDSKNLQDALALSNDEIRQINVMRQYMLNKAERSNICQYLYEYGLELASNILTINYLATELESSAYILNLEYLQSLRTAKFPISGNDLKELGIIDGIAIGNALKSLKELWYQSEYKLNKEALIALLNK